MEPSKADMSLVHPSFSLPLLPLLSSFPSHLHVHETHKITRTQLFWVRQRKPEAQENLGLSEKNLKSYAIIHPLHLM